MNLKKTLLSLFILAFVFNVYSQENTKIKHKSKIGLTYSTFGDNDVIRFQELIGSASYNGEKFYTIGINYIYKFNKHFDIESGIEYSKHAITVHPHLGPTIDVYAYSTNLYLINIPVSIRLNFMKYFFINTGLLFDIDISDNSPVDNQTGIGSVAGLGVEYDFNFGVSLFVNPYIKAHALLPFSQENYPQRIIKSGIKFGITYNLK